MTKRLRKQVLFPGGEGAPTVVKNDKKAHDCPPIIRELPTCRIVEFYGAHLHFWPYQGTYYLPVVEAVRALALDDHGDPARQALCKRGKALYFEGISVGNGTNSRFVSICYARLAASHLASISGSGGQVTRAVRFAEVLTRLGEQARHHAPIHSHNLPWENAYLNAVLDKYPHWADILTLWNKGKTEGEIADALQVNRTNVRSAVLHLEKNGFEVLKGEQRNRQKEYQGQAYQIPGVKRVKNGVHKLPKN